MKFRTEIIIPKSTLKIEHDNKIMTIGSCFAENIAEYFIANRFNALPNPFGVLYNPVSILNAFKFIREKKIFTENDLIFAHGEWHSFFHHSSFSHHEKDNCLQNINSNLESASKFINAGDVLIITYGTAFVYEYLKTKQIVSNCHKIHAGQFSCSLLSLEEVKKIIDATIQLIKKINPGIRIIFTISPVRHWKNGAVENQYSKSILHVALRDVIDKENNCVYFPSYEIMMDDLRDYRFYNEDLLHPNKMATDYIWEKFSGAFFTDKCKATIDDISKITRARQHRVRNIDSEVHQKFITEQLSLIQNLSNKYSYLDLSADSTYFTSQKKL